MLQDARSLLQRLEQQLSPRSPREAFEEVQVHRDLFRSLKRALQQKAVQLAHERNKDQAEHHA